MHRYSVMALVKCKGRGSSPSCVCVWGGGGGGEEGEEEEGRRGREGKEGERGEEGGGREGKEGERGRRGRKESETRRDRRRGKMDVRKEDEQLACLPPFPSFWLQLPQSPKATSRKRP